MSEASPIVLISGPPGAGKSTVARQLVASSKTPIAYLEGDTFWSFIAKSKAFEDKNEGRRQNARIVIRAMMAAAVRYARGGYETVLDFTIGPWHLKAMHAALKETPLDYVILYPNETVCAERAAARSEGAMPDYAPYRDLHAAFGEAGEFERHVLRDHQGSAAELAAQIRTSLDAGIYRVNGL